MTHSTMSVATATKTAAVIVREDRKNLKARNIPISNSFYVMGTADPTNTLNCNDVCVILLILFGTEHGQSSGPVLVYRNHDIHPEDINVVTARYVKALEEIVGNSKYGIFFPSKGPTSMAHEIAAVDYDGDMYSVYRDPEVSMKPVRTTAKELVGTTGPSSIRLKLIGKTKMYKLLGSKELEHQMFICEDQEGAEVQAVLFKPDLEIFQDIMQDCMTYEISNARVKLLPANESVNSDKQAYQLIFTDNTFVLPISDPPPPIKFNYILIGSIPRAYQHSNQFDVLGIVVYVDKTVEVTQHSDEAQNICEVFIVDQSSEQIMMVSAWENMAIDQCRALQPIAGSFPVVSFAALLPSCRKGFSLSTTHLTCVSVEPQGQAAETLRAWGKGNHHKLAARHRQVLQSRQTNTNRTITAIEKLLQKKVSDTFQGERHWLRVKLPDLAPKDVLLYCGCAKCGTGNYETCGAAYTCTGCFEIGVISSPRMCFPFVAMDETGAYCFSARTKDAEAILQMDAAKMHSMTSQARENYLMQIITTLKKNPIYIEVVPSFSLSRTQVLKWVLQHVSLT